MLIPYHQSFIVIKNCVIYDTHDFTPINSAGVTGASNITIRATDNDTIRFISNTAQAAAGEVGAAFGGSHRRGPRDRLPRDLRRGVCVRGLRRLCPGGFGVHEEWGGGDDKGRVWGRDGLGGSRQSRGGGRSSLRSCFKSKLLMWNLRPCLEEKSTVTSISTFLSL